MPPAAGPDAAEVRRQERSTELCLKCQYFSGFILEFILLKNGAGVNVGVYKSIKGGEGNEPIQCIHTRSNVFPSKEGLDLRG